MRDHAVKVLTNLARYLGTCQEFKKRLKDYGVKTFRPNAFASFLRILNSSNNSDLPTWYRKAINVLGPNERLFLGCAAVTGLRKNEVIQSFNLIIELCESEDLQKYYNEELNCLQHF